MSDVIDFGKGDGLVPVVVQDDASGTVLMLAYMNRAAFERTVASGYATYWSRSRRDFWVKGETSGHRQLVRAIHVDCDGDTVLLRVVQQGGAACHEGYESCFFRRLDGDAWRVVAERVVDPATLYPKKS
ncbi:MAG TPA: phosphoribosyl-AMP cyclohydrolase [Candidatus Binatia bacterium]|jgi:phosphoribosyl-AMP cyclohydrolase